MVAESDVSFRPRKRQKIYKKRPEDGEEQETSASASLPTTSLETDSKATSTPIEAAPSDDAPEGGLSVAEILRRRKLGKARGGVEFSSNAPRATSEMQMASMVGTATSDAAALEAAAKRFAPQTGVMANTLDKHMMAYIDSKMAEMREGAEQHNQTTTQHAGLIDNTTTAAQQTAADAQSRERQPAGLGKLQEVDLGPDATLRNIERTEAATRRLRGEEPEQDPRRSGGKPWRRKRRTSEDIKRDQMIEAVLRESRLDLYTTPNLATTTSSSNTTAGGTNPLTAPANNDDEDAEAADDRIVEEFRREFLDALQSRNRAPPPSSSANAAGGAGGRGGKADERPKGPKLGGSRSARAAMRALEEREKGRKR